MSLLLVVLSLNVLPDFNDLSPMLFNVPETPAQFSDIEGWSLDCTAVDFSGRIVAGCSRWNRELAVHEVQLYLIGESVDTVTVVYDRMTNPSSILPDSRGGYLVTYPPDINSDDISVARLDADGALDWNIDGYGETEQTFIGLTAFTETPYGDCVLGGNPYTGNGGRNFHIAVLGEDGDLQWEVSGESPAQVHAVAATSHGLILAGENSGSGETQAYAWFYGYSGNLLWDQGYDPGGFTEFSCVAQMADGFIFGGTHWSMEGPQYGLLIRADSSGNEIWRKLVPPAEGYQQVYFQSVLADGDGNIYAAGFSALDNAPRNTDDAMLLLLSESGDVRDAAFYGKPEENHEEFNSIFHDNEDCIRIYGQCFGEDYDGKQLFGFPPFNVCE